MTLALPLGHLANSRFLSNLGLEELADEQRPAVMAVFHQNFVIDLPAGHKDPPPEYSGCLYPILVVIRSVSYDTSVS